MYFCSVKRKGDIRRLCGTTALLAEIQVANVKARIWRVGELGGQVPFNSSPKGLLALLCYRRQTKFAKVMFSQVSVCPRGMSAQLFAGIHPPGTRGRHPPGRHPLSGQTPPVQCTLGYGQQAGSMHPTRMRSCFEGQILAFSLDFTFLRVQCVHLRFNFF